MRLNLAAVYLVLAVEAFFFSAFFAVAPEVKDMLELSTFEIGVSLTGLGVAMALFALPAGFLIDRGGPRRLTIIGSLVLLASAIGHAVAVDVWSLLGARMLLGIAATFVLPAGYTWLRDLVPTERRSMALSTVMPIIGVGSIVGPVAAGAIADATGARVAFWVIAGLIVASTLLLLATARPGADHEPEPAAPPRAVLSLLRTEPLLLGGCVTVIVATLSESVVNFLVPLQLDGQGVSATTIGVYLAVGSILFVLVGGVVARLADRTVDLLVSGIATLVIALLLVPLIASDTVGVLVSVLILRMGALGVLWTIAFPLGGLGATRAGMASGAIFGVFMATIGVCSVVGTLAGGALADGPGFSTAYLALTAACALAALALLRLAQRETSTQPSTTRVS